jgi:predicted enzyme related to lactoylglutathione lyase
MPHIRAGAVIYANNYERLSSFYEDVAGLDVRETDETSTILESETFQLVILQVPSHIATSIKIGEPTIRREGTPIKLVFYVGSISNTREKVMALGGELNAKEKEWEFDKHRVCDGNDPEGNIFQIRAQAL